MQQCKAQSKSTGEQCRKAAMTGQLVCRSHGGAAGQNRAAAARRRVEEQAASTLNSLGAPVPVDNPFEELSRVAGEVLALKDLVAAEVTKLEGVLTYEFTAGEFEGIGQAREDVRAVVAAYERALDRSAKVLVAMGKIDIAGRWLALNQARANLMVGAVERGLAVCGLSPADERAVKTAIADELASVSTTSQ